jgi:hypothetical protein
MLSIAVAAFAVDGARLILVIIYIDAQLAAGTIL